MEADVCVMNADGTDRVNLTNSPVYEGEPRWSPDGQHIAFTSLKEHYSVIYVMDADGENVRLVLDGADYWDEPGFRFGWPAWTPDGEWITFAVERYFASFEGPYIVSVSGGPVHLLTHESFGLAGPLSYSPDKSQVVFGDYWDLYIMRADGSLPEAIVMSNPDGPGSAAWSPDGRQIAFSRIGSAGILIVNRDGTDKRALWADPEYREAAQPAWSPDGRYLAFDARPNLERDIVFTTLLLYDLTNGHMVPFPGAQPGDCCADWRADQP